MSIDPNEYKLICDVQLPPATIIKRGCTLNTLLVAIRQRENFPPAERVFNNAASAERPAPARVVMPELANVSTKRLEPHIEQALNEQAFGLYIGDEVARLNASPADHGWISVEDRLPVEGSKDEYLIYCSTGAVAMSDYVYDEQCGWGFWYDPDATHWMPLPPPPAQRTGGAE